MTMIVGIDVSKDIGVAIKLPLAADLIRMSEAYTVIRSRPEMKHVDGETDPRRRRAMVFQGFRRHATFATRMKVLAALRDRQFAYPDVYFG